MQARSMVASAALFFQLGIIHNYEMPGLCICRPMEQYSRPAGFFDLLSFSTGREASNARRFGVEKPIQENGS